MVDYSNGSGKIGVSTDLEAKVRDIKGMYGNDEKIDHYKEYEELGKLLSGEDDANKEYIQGFMIEYEDQYKTSKQLREDVLRYLGDDKKITEGNNVEKEAIKTLLKGVKNKWDKAYLKRILDGKEAVDVEPKNEDGLNNLLSLKEKGQETSPKKSEKNPPKPGFGVGKIPVEVDDKNKPVKLPNPITEDQSNVKPEPLPDRINPENGNEKPVILPYPIPKVQNNNQDNSLKINEPIQGKQVGEVNVIADDGSTVIIEVGEKVAEKAGKLADGDEETSNVTTNEPKKLTPKEKAEARELGRQVSDLLTNDYTERFEQVIVSNILKNDVNESNVLEFLKGYEKKGSGDHFFEQMITEYSFEEKESLMRKVAGDLIKKLEADGWTSDAEEISVILAKTPLTKQDAKELDKIAQRYLVELK